MPAHPKHPSMRSRARDARRGVGFRLLSADQQGAVPPWPLPPDVARTAELESLRDKVAGLQVAIAGESDGRKKGRLTRQLNQVELAVAKLELELEQAGDAEQALWAEVWTYPQAVMWAESKSDRSVALYVRTQIRAESGDLKAATEARQWSDRLGLTSLSLLRLRAEVERVEEAEQRGTRRRTDKAPGSKGKPAKDPREFLRGLG